MKPEEIERVLDEVEAVQSALVGEALFVHSELAGIPVGPEVKDLGLFLRLARWWFRRKRKYYSYLEKLLGLPPGAQLLGRDTTSFFMINEKGERVEVRVRYSGYDLLEFLVLNTVLEDEEGRKQLVDATVETVKNSRISVSGKVMTMKEYVEKVLGTDWSKFEESLRRELEASIASYMHEIRNTEGSPLAKHIYLRERAVERGDAPWLWLLRFNQLYSLTIMATYAKAYASKYWRVSRKEEKRSAAEFYGFITRFKTVVSSSLTEELEAVREMKKFLFIKPKLSIEEAKREYERIVEAAQRAASIIPAEFLPPEVMSPLTMLPVRGDEVRRVAKKKMEERELELNIH